MIVTYPLASYRVLDLTDDKGYICGRILAELGADVIKIESVGGDLGRQLGLFYHDEPDLDFPIPALITATAHIRIASCAPGPKLRKSALPSMLLSMLP